ncbi:energy transducer TonB [candidate division KSB1 bacterium]|nr:energy transducer TonB [candidate division KSB1 bacterium]
MLIRTDPRFNLKLKYKKTVELGMIIALVFVIAAVMGFKRFEGQKAEKVEIDIKIEVEEIPKTEQIKRPPPPARPAIPIESEDEDIPDDATIDPTTELDFDDLPPAPEPPEEEDESASVFVAFDEPPQPIGGFPAIQRNLKYPEIARKAGVEGKVLVHVKVDKTGKVVDTKILISLGNNGCDEAAIEAIKKVKWKPAYQRDKPVTVWVAIPVIFKLK